MKIDYKQHKENHDDAMMEALDFVAMPSDGKHRSEIRTKLKLSHQEKKRKSFSKRSLRFFYSFNFNMSIRFMRYYHVVTVY